tara:strand:+ start:329946 stop:331850 length:1905 start_codon:yes stop_codon:yes gene_type:complete
MTSLKSSFAAVMLVGSLTATNVSAENVIPDGTQYKSDDRQNTQMYERVNELPEGATHIYVPEQEYHDKLGERTWITENQFMRGLSYMQYMGVYNGRLEYSHSAVPQFQKLLDQFIDRHVVTDAKPEDYKNDLYAKYDMLRVHALENEVFVDHVLQQGEEYQRLKKNTDYHGDIKQLDGQLGLMGQDYNVGTKNDGLRMQAIQKFRESRTALDFLESPQWDKGQSLSAGQTELMKNGLALLGYNDASEGGALAAFYKDQNIEIDPPQYNLEALASLHEHVVKDGKAFDRVEAVLYDFDTVEQQVGYAQSVLTLYGEHTEMDNQRWAHTMLNVAQLSRRMGDDLEIVKEDAPQKIYSNASHVFWDAVRWGNDEAGAPHTLPDINDVANMSPPSEAANLGGEDMRWGNLSGQQKAEFESSFVSIPLSEFEKFLPEGADELKTTQQGKAQIQNHIFKFDANGIASFKDPALTERYAQMQDFFKEQISQRSGAQDYSAQELEGAANNTARLAMMQVIDFMTNPRRGEYSNDETSTLYMYMPDREGSRNAMKDSGNTFMRTEHYDAVVHCVNERNYLNYRAEGGDKNAPIPFEEAQSDINVDRLAQTAQQLSEARGIVVPSGDSKAPSTNTLRNDQTLGL